MTTNPQSASGDRPSPHRPASGDSTPRRVLEEVLRQTAELYSLEQESDPADLEPLLDVARRLQGSEFELDPVLIELVRAALQRQLGPARGSDEQFAAMVQRVAEVFYENPESHARMRALWERLSAVA